MSVVVDLGGIYFIPNVSFVPGLDCAGDYSRTNNMKIGVGMLRDGSDVSYIYNAGTITGSAGSWVTEANLNTHAR